VHWVCKIVEIMLKKLHGGKVVGGGGEINCGKLL